MDERNLNKNDAEATSSPFAALKNIEGAGGNIETFHGRTQEELKSTQQEQLNPEVIIGVAAQYGVELAVANKPPEGEMLTGDMYYAVERGESKLSVFLGDVAGHGKESGADSVKVVEMLNEHSFAPIEDGSAVNAADELYMMHDAFCDERRRNEDAYAREEFSVSMLHVLLETDSKKLHYANAGMEKVVVLKDGGTATILNRGVYLGSEAVQNFDVRQMGLIEDEKSYEWESGDMLLMFSDGIDDGIESGERTASDELVDFMETDEAAAMSPAALVTHAMNMRAQSEDDMTVMTLKLP